MSINQKKKPKAWLSNLYHIGTLLTLFFIMAQVFLARNSMKQSSEWEKAKTTIENIERFRENLTHTILYDKIEELDFSNRLWPDFTTSAGLHTSDTLRHIYYNLFDDEYLLRKDFDYTLSVMDAFAYPIIMGYANELVSYQSVGEEYYTYGNYMMPLAFSSGRQKGQNAKLLYRLWRVRSEQEIFKEVDKKIVGVVISIEDVIDYLRNNMKYLLCFEGTEVTPTSLKQYEKKLEKELKKIQKEIEDYRKSSLK